MNFIHPAIRCQLERIEEEFRHEIRSISTTFANGLLECATVKLDHCPAISCIRVREKQRFEAEPAVTIFGTGAARFKPMAVHCLIQRLKDCLDDLVQCEACSIIGEHSDQWHVDDENIHLCTKCLKGYGVTE